MEHKIFVYGTLMDGFKNYNRYLERNVKSITPAYTLGKLYHLKKYGCPAMIPGKDKVQGQLITYFDDEKESLTKAVDEFESCFDDNNRTAYIRKKIRVFYKENEEEEDIDCYIFVDNNRLKPEDIIYIENGDWRNFIIKNK